MRQLPIYNCQLELFLTYEIQIKNTTQDSRRVLTGFFLTNLVVISYMVEIHMVQMFVLDLSDVLNSTHLNHAIFLNWDFPCVGFGNLWHFL